MTADTPAIAINGATLAVEVEFAQRPKGAGKTPVKPTCVVKANNTGGATASCQVVQFLKGGVSSPGEFNVVIQQASGS